MQQVTLKMLLNAHSTAVMAGLGRLVGNTMTNVSPSNLKLIGRATNLIAMHANQSLAPYRYYSVKGKKKCQNRMFDQI
jgi:N-acetylmuramic acid 6-phosphate etherase